MVAIVGVGLILIYGSMPDKPPVYPKSSEYLQKHQNQHGDMSMSPEDYRTPRDQHEGGRYEHYQLEPSAHAAQVYQPFAREYDAPPRDLYYQVELTGKLTAQSFEHSTGGHSFSGPCTVRDALGLHL
jgi:hypothetical protein